MGEHGYRGEPQSSISPACWPPKDQGGKGNVGGVAFLLKKNKIDVFHGAGSLIAPGGVKVALNGERQREASRPGSIVDRRDGLRTLQKLPGIDIDEDTVVSSTGALSLHAGSPSGC